MVTEVHTIRAALADFLRAPRRWTGGLRRTAAARAIHGSNTIEGYTVTDDDAVAAIDDEPPLSADEETWAEIIGYRRVLTYVLSVATEPAFVIDESVLKSMHFMLLDHDLMKWPGRYRAGPVYVRDDRTASTANWNPDGDATAWTKFNLRAHHMQAQTVRRRFAEAEHQWNLLDELMVHNKLPERGFSSSVRRAARPQGHPAVLRQGLPGRRTHGNARPRRRDRGRPAHSAG